MLWNVVEEFESRKWHNLIYIVIRSFREILGKWHSELKFRTPIFPIPYQLSFFWNAENRTSCLTGLQQYVFVQGFFFKIWRRKHVKSWWWVWGSSNSGSSCARSIAKEDTQMGWGNCCAQDWKYIKTFNWREHRREKPPSGASTETCQLVVTHHLLPGSQPVYLLLRFPTAWTIQETWPSQ